jgi:two-component system, response regulator, stage 0 sporulation protein F
MGDRMKKHILVIDDERLMCYGLKKALSQDLIEVDTASSASEAILALSACNYDVCLLDIRLPDDSGFKMMEVIRDFCPKIKIILMTTSDLALDDAMNENIRKAKANGACNFLCKPFDLKQLRGVIASVLRENGGKEVADRFEQDFAVRTRRRETRKKWPARINFFMSVINGGEVKRRIFPAETVDVSEDGVGLITPCPLKPTQVISFDETLGRRSGVVVWSNLLDDRRCRAGIRFA